LNLDNYLKKVYNVAFRLTGDENKAANLAFEAINSCSYTLDISDKVDSAIFNISAKEVCRLFLTDYDKGNELFRRFENNTYEYPYQRALMSLSPLRRTLIVWRDVLRLSLDDMKIEDYNVKELYFELNKGRKLIKDLLNEDFINETGA